MRFWQRIYTAAIRCWWESILRREQIWLSGVNNEEASAITAAPAANSSAANTFLAKEDQQQFVVDSSCIVDGLVAFFLVLPIVGSYYFIFGSVEKGRVYGIIVIIGLPLPFERCTQRRRNQHRNIQYIFLSCPRNNPNCLIYCWHEGSNTLLSIFYFPSPIHTPTNGSYL